jgi:monofunctional biosynthetic peptidoglycan transglycosylase
MRAFPSDRIGRLIQPRKKRRGRKSGTGKQGAWLRRLARLALITAATAFVLSMLLVVPLRWIDPPTTAFMLRDGSGRIPVLYAWVDWENIGTTAALAVVASEDQKFADHFGFDVKSIRESVADFSDGSPLRGASTITQQVAKNLYLWSGKSFLRKGIEAYFTVLIETTWSKKRILEVYLNIAELGPGVYGVGAASEVFYGKAPSRLSDAEAALLAAVLPNPTRLQVDNPTSYVRERQNWILGQMRRLRREHWVIRLD